MHKVKEGPANQSYGLQVAKLAGVPASVVTRARKYLAMLEQQAGPHRETPSPQQELVFQPEPEDDPLREAVDELNPDDLSPREALDALYRLKKLLQHMLQ